MRKTNRLSLLPLALLCACTNMTSAPYANPGDPERQIIRTTEMLPLSLTSPQSLDQLREILRSDPPSAATLGCDSKQPICQDARKLLLAMHVPLELTEKEEGVVLTYNRVTAVACDQRFKNNHLNNKNLNHEAFGCSIRSNMVQSVTDKQQFINPGLLDYMDGEKAALNYQKYISPPAESDAASQNGAESLIGTAGATQ